MFETTDAVRAGASEIDVVVNLGLVKDGDWDGVLAELHAVRDACQGKVAMISSEEASGFSRVWSTLERMSFTSMMLFLSMRKIYASILILPKGRPFVKVSYFFVGRQS